MGMLRKKGNVRKEKEGEKERGRKREKERGGRVRGDIERGEKSSRYKVKDKTESERELEGGAACVFASCPPKTPMA